MSTYNRKAYKKYITDVLDGKIVAGKWVKLACQRARDFEQRDDIYFDDADVDRRIKFIYKLKHYEGDFNGQHFELLPWQQFVISQIFAS
jgi:phage terminase large subunit-like protein